MDNVNIDGNIDINFDAQFTTARQVLLKYTNALEKLRQVAEQKHHVPSYHFDNYLLLKYFQQSNDDSSSDGEPLLHRSIFRMELLKHIRNRRHQIVYWLTYCFLMIVLSAILFFVYRHNQMMQNRNFVYPSLRIWRRLTLPLIQRFPRLTELYDESCILGNPFYQTEDLNCDPCAHVDSVLELLENNSSDPVDISHREIHEFVPVLFKINQSSIHMQDFINIYRNNEDIFRRDAYRVQSTSRHINNLEELFSQFNNSNSDDVKKEKSEEQTHHSLWRCIRMLPARLLRPLLASSRTSSYLPTTGKALERFISFDTYNAPTYTLPDTECSNVYIQQLRGTRFIILRPTSECRHRCRTLSMRLPQSFVLSYNWWYWKPISAPDPVAETSSISLIGSYC